MRECILLVPNNIKKEIIKLVRKDYYNYNIKFMSLEEFKKKYIFDYDRKTIYNLLFFSICCYCYITRYNS